MAAAGVPGTARGVKGRGDGPDPARLGIGTGLRVALRPGGDGEGLPCLGEVEKALLLILDLCPEEGLCWTRVTNGS